MKGPQRLSVELVLPGGTVDGVRYLISETVNLMEGGRYLLFLHPQDGRLHVQGGEQGAVRITRDGARRGVSLQGALASVEGCSAR